MKGESILPPSTCLYLSSLILVITPEYPAGLVLTTLLELLSVSIPMASQLPKLMASSSSTTLPHGPLMTLLHSFNDYTFPGCLLLSSHFAPSPVLTTFLTSATTKSLASISFPLLFFFFICPGELISPTIYELMSQNQYLQPLSNYSETSENFSFS